MQAHQDTLDERFDFCRQLARRAGERAHAGFGSAAATLKGRHDVLTAMDADVERFIRAAIAQRYPGEAVLGEEDGASGRLDAGGRIWIVDPIDGTANYARGIAHYCVSIACVEDGQPLVGALHDPCHDRLYGAALGGGAWLGTQRLAVSPLASLEAATVECGWSPRRPAADWLALVERVMSSGCAVRRAGSGALGLADVAAGRVEAYCELHINSWDCAAGILLVREAGGHTNDFFAGSGLTGGNPLVATNHALREALSRTIGIPA